MPAVPALALIASVGSAVYSANLQRKAANAQAATATAVADYNARVDLAQSEQTDLDARANIAAMRRDASVYMSRQTAAFAAAGVRADSGSPLAVRAATAGRLAMREQQAYTDSQAKQQRLAAAAKAGRAEGQAAADGYHMQATAAVLNGAGRVASQLGGAYQSGMFSGSATNDLSAGLRSSTAAGATDLPAIGAGGYA